MWPHAYEPEWTGERVRWLGQLGCLAGLAWLALVWLGFGWLFLGFRLDFGLISGFGLISNVFGLDFSLISFWMLHFRFLLIGFF